MNAWDCDPFHEYAQGDTFAEPAEDDAEAWLALTMDRFGDRLVKGDD